jgi:hypothetical protein
LLVLLLHPRALSPRFLLALLLLLGLPYLLQSPAYVNRQYASWWLDRLRHADEARRFWPVHMAYRDLWLLLRVVGVPMSLPMYQVVQGALAAGCAGVCLLSRRCDGERRALLVVLTLGLTWLMLCGPATESATYVLFAPVLAWGLVEAWFAPWPRPAQVLATLAGGLLLACVLAGAFPGAVRIHALGLHPLAVLLYSSAFLGVTVTYWLQRGRGASVVDPAALTRAA